MADTKNDTQSKPTSKPTTETTKPDTGRTATQAYASPVSETAADVESPAPGTISSAPLSDAQSPIPRDDEGRIIPTPGDVRTEPVATAYQSHVEGRVGPRTIQEDSTATWMPGGGLDQVDPGAVLADTPEGTGPITEDVAEDPQGERLAAIHQAAEDGHPVRPADA
jgi:hypothetical protein